MRLKTITGIALLLGFIAPAQPMASMAVIDATAVGKLTDQLPDCPGGGPVNA